MERTAGNEAGPVLKVVAPGATEPSGESTPAPEETPARDALPPRAAEPREAVLRPGERLVFCATCGKQNVTSAKFCGGCGATMALPVPARPAVPQRGLAPGRDAGLRQRGDKQYAVGKNPTVALLLSLLIVGLGQFYNGDNKKGALMLVGALVLAAATVGLAWVLMVIWSAVDAYKVAKGETPLWT